jgi:c-di-GMP-related signal transduction protein
VSDQEQFKAMLDRAGVVYKYQDDDPPGTLTIEAKDGEKNKGYTYFIAQFVFREDGSLDHVGIWE